MGQTTSRVAAPLVALETQNRYARCQRSLRNSGQRCMSAIMPRSFIKSQLVDEVFIVGHLRVGAKWCFDHAYFRALRHAALPVVGPKGVDLFDLLW